MYAILDIETTGGKYGEEGITEIAIYRFDGHEVVDQFISLINPERPIQAFVVGLTGINNEMLRHAPKFYEVAKRIIEITEGCIIVAHNAQFDYRILGTEFDRLGYDFQRKSLCTVELAQELLPGHKSYSLGKLARALGIPVTSRHRASGDALATVQLFKLLLSKDVKKSIISETVRANPRKHMDTKLKDIIEEIPSITGVYYMHGSKGELLYIGKSKNIKRRLNQHFTNDNRKSKELQEAVNTVTYDETGTELIALLKENEEIKKNRPPFNKALRKTLFKVQMASFVDKDGYINLKMEKADAKKKSITTFSNHMAAKSYLERTIEEYELCQCKVGVDRSKGNCFNHSIKKCHGACIGRESIEIYNGRMEKLIARYSYADKSMLIIDRGRNHGERSVIWIDEGVFRGVGFYNLNFQIENPEVLESIVTAMDNNRDARHIIQSYMRRKKVLRTIPLETTPN